MDWEKIGAYPDNLLRLLGDRITEQLKNCDAIIITDYGKGMFFTSAALGWIPLARALGIPVILDPCLSTRMGLFQEVSHIKCNKKEYLKIGALFPPNAVTVVTEGDNGMWAYGGGMEQPLHVDGLPVKAIDATGAGDTVAAALALGLASRYPLLDCLIECNRMGAHVVQKPRIAVARREEL